MIDAKVILNYSPKRDSEDYEQSSEIIMKCPRAILPGISPSTPFPLFGTSLEERGSRSKRIPKGHFEIFTVANASQEAIIAAIENSQFADFEVCLQDKCAADVSADYIITCNVKDYANSEVKAITPGDFVRKINAQE